MKCRQMICLTLIIGENMTCEETKRNKARNLRYKKAIVRDLNYESILQKLWEIQEECEEIKWFDSDEETLINNLIGDDDEAFEFKMMFSDLCHDCECMMEDLRNEYVSEYFDDFLVSFSGNDFGGGLYGWDPYENDYMPLGSHYECTEANKESMKRLMRLTKKQLIEESILCFHVAMNYISLENRYSNLKSAIDILRDQNIGYLQVVKQIDESYEKANADDFCDWEPSVKKFNNLINQMPQDAWLQ